MDLFVREVEGRLCGSILKHKSSATPIVLYYISTTIYENINYLGHILLPIQSWIEMQNPDHRILACVMHALLVYEGHLCMAAWGTPCIL